MKTESLDSVSTEVTENNTPPGGQISPIVKVAMFATLMYAVYLGISQIVDIFKFLGGLSFSTIMGAVCYAYIMKLVYQDKALRDALLKISGAIMLIAVLGSLLGSRDD